MAKDVNLHKLPYILQADLIRIVATFAVISIHVTDILLSYRTYVGGTSWWFANILNSLSRVSVPLFIMLSGWMVWSNFDPVTGNQKILGKTVHRILIPLAFWIIINGLWLWYWHAMAWDVNTFLYKLWSGSWFHLYFLIILSGLYLITPWLNQLKTKSLYFLTASTVIWGLGNTALKYIWPEIYTESNIFTWWIPYLGYYLAGRILGNFNFKNSLRYLGFTLWVLGGLLTACFVYANITKWDPQSLENSKGQYMWEYLTPHIIVMSLGAFIFLRNYASNLKNKFVPKLVREVSGLTFGVYLIHPIIMDLLDHFFGMSIHLINSNLWLYEIVKIATTFGFSILIIKALSLSKAGRCVVGMKI